MAAVRGIGFFLLLVLIACHTANTNAIGFDSIYQFGDSLSDTGNLMMESNTSFCSVPPYGLTSLPKSGRCSDGLLMIDFFARQFNLPLLEPYLKKDANFSHGINFAVAGATALSGTRYPAAATNSSLDVQLGWFRTHLESVCPSTTTTPEDCNQKFKRTLFIMGEVGGNDYNYGLLMGGGSIQAILNLVPEVIKAITDAVTEVIGRGAVQVVVPGNFAIGCMPAYLTTFRSNDSTLYDELGCVKPLNEFANLHNNQLKQAIKDLQKQHPNVSIHYGDYYNGLRSILRNATSLGFVKEEALTPCCGDVVHFCGGKGVGVCSDPKKRINWDGVHLTQEAYRNLAHWLLADIFPQSTTAPAPAPAPAPTPYHSEPSGAEVKHSGADVVSISMASMLASLALLAAGSNLF